VLREGPSTVLRAGFDCGEYAFAQDATTMIRRAATLFAPVPPPIGFEPLELKSPRRRAMGSIIGHTGFNVARYHTTHVFGALFPLLAGALFFGWRAIVSVLIVVGTTLLAGLVWRRIGTRGHPLRPAQLLWLGLVLAMMLPANLLHAADHSPWPILPAAGLMIVILCWALGGIWQRPVSSGRSSVSSARPAVSAATEIQHGAATESPAG